MTEQSSKDVINDFVINRRWPANNPDILQLYSLPTPNGQKVSIMLEETGLEYEPHRVPFGDEGTQSPEFLSLNPNNKIPAIVDPNGPEGKPLGLFESGAILVYLAEKTGMLYGTHAAERYEVLQWLMFQMGGVGPMFGQLGFFYVFGGSQMDDKLPLERYVNESKRLLNVVNQRLEGREWLVDRYSIADIAIGPWLNCIVDFYKAADITELHKHQNVLAYMDRFNARSAVQSGKNIPAND